MTILYAIVAIKDYIWYSLLPQAVLGIGFLITVLCANRQDRARSAVVTTARAIADGLRGQVWDVSKYAVGLGPSASELCPSARPESTTKTVTRCCLDWRSSLKVHAGSTTDASWRSPRKRGRAMNKNARPLSSVFRLLEYRGACRHFVSMRELLRLRISSPECSSDIEALSLQCAYAYLAYCTAFHLAQDGGWSRDELGWMIGEQPPPRPEDADQAESIAASLVRSLLSEEDEDSFLVGDLTGMDTLQ